MGALVLYMTKKLIILFIITIELKVMINLSNLWITRNFQKCYKSIIVEIL